MLRHAEVLEHGELGTRPLRQAAATDRLILAGDGELEWEPEFTFHGFRYAEVSGWPGEFDPSAVTAVVIHSDMERTGWFETSHELVNKLHENVVWGLRGNFLYVPTDCPQRDERLGWTGDIQVFAPTASFLYDVRGFLDSWLRDLALEQEHEGGIVPNVVPNVLGTPRPAAAWGDAATVVPWVLNERYADVAILERQYPSMKAWTDVAARHRRASGGSGRASSSTATGSTRTPRRTCRRAPRPTRTSSQARTSSAPPMPSREPRGCSATRPRPSATPRSRRRCGRHS